MILSPSKVKGPRDEMQHLDDGVVADPRRNVTSRSRLRRGDVSAFPYLVKVADGIYRIPPFPPGHELEGALLVVDDVVALFDTGVAYRQVQELRPYVDVVVNSHAHFGHTGRNYLFDEVWALDSWTDIVEDIDKALAFHGGVGTPVETWWRDWMLRARSEKAGKVTRRLRAEDVLDFGRTRWQLLLTPGHCPGHLCFYEANLGVLYCGDITLMSFGPHYGAPNSSLVEFKRSMDLLMDLDTRAIATSAKGPYYGDATERLRAFNDHFEKRDLRLIDSLRKPLGIESLVDRLLIYGRMRDPWMAHYVRFSERNMVEKHLEVLTAQGRVTNEDGLYRAR